MLRSTRIAIAIAAVCAVAVSASASAVAAAPAPSGTLTAVEYTQLSKSMAAIKKFSHSKRATWNQGYAACHEVGQSTALLRSVRTNCDTAIGIDQSLVGFYAQISSDAQRSRRPDVDHDDTHRNDHDRHHDHWHHHRNDHHRYDHDRHDHDGHDRRLTTAPNFSSSPACSPSMR